jgi:hypothetical protein
MRLNLARSQKGLAGTFIETNVKLFAVEYDFPTYKQSLEYVRSGRQGLKAFVEFLVMQGYAAEMYCLDPNKDLFLDVGDQWQAMSRTSPSFGFSIPENDSKLVEFKLKHS